MKENKVNYREQIDLMPPERIASLLDIKMNKLNDLNHEMIEISNKYVKMNSIAKEEYSNIFAWIIEDMNGLLKLIKKEEEY